MRLVLMFLSFIMSVSINAQKEDYIWIGGYQTNQTGQGVHGYKIDFNEDAKISYANPMLGFLGNNASICDKEGNLLFYTNGRGVLNRNHQIMPNGDSINEDLWSQKLWPKPFRGYPGAQDVMILQDPGFENGYYLFHKKNIYYPMFPDSQALNFTYIDITLDGELGDVVKKNVKYFGHLNALGNYFTAINHQNKKDWWIIQPLVEDSIFLTFLLNESGIVRDQDQNTHQYFDSYRSSASGTSKFSPDGTKYALYNYYDQLHVYDFDRLTGILSNHKKINVFPEDSIEREQIRFSSLEWSPNGRFIYTATYLELHQIDMWATDPENAIQLIDTYNGTLDPFPTELFLMVQAPDCKIYMAPKNGSNSIHIIKKPNELGKACDFVQNGIKLPYPNGGEMPNFPRFRVDEVDKCDPTITSVFGDDVYYRRDLVVYPNPTSGLINIDIPENIGKSNLVVTDISGQILIKKEIFDSELENIDLSLFPSGNYNIEIYPIENKERIFYGRQVVKI